MVQALSFFSNPLSALGWRGWWVVVNYSSAKMLVHMGKAKAICFHPLSPESAHRREQGCACRECAGSVSGSKKAELDVSPRFFL